MNCERKRVKAVYGINKDVGGSVEQIKEMVKDMEEM